MDTLIGAHALSLDAVVVSRNRRDFERIAGLPVEDWTS
jgi:tRNA(fMet)-specific endonuclease VapC